MTRPSRYWLRGHQVLAVGVGLLLPACACAVQDVMLQTVDGKIVTGIVDDVTGVGTLGTRVFRGNFFAGSFITADPGFFGLATASPSMPPGAAGFPSNHDIGFDLLAMRIGSVKSNLFFWDGLTPEVDFGSSQGVSWRIVDDASNTFFVPGTDEFIPGGRIDPSSADTDPSDGIDTGRVHSHLALQLVASGTPPQGVYMVAWQARSAGFETSEPFLFVHRTSTISNAVRDVAAQWAEQHIGAMFGPRLPGDYNEDNVVDAGDYVYWRNRLGMEMELPNEDDSFGVVDLADYTVWKSHYGQSIGDGGGEGGMVRWAPGDSPGAKWVPETASLVLASVGGGMLAFNGRTRWRPIRRGPGSTRRRC